MNHWQIAIAVMTVPLPILLAVLGAYAIPQLEREAEGGVPYPLAGVGLLFVAGFFLLIVRILVGLAA